MLKGVAGLGNRIDAFLGAVAFSLASCRKLVVDWGDGLYAPPNDERVSRVFLQSGIPTEVELASLERMSVAPAAWRGALGQIGIPAPSVSSGGSKKFTSGSRTQEVIDY